MVAWRQKPKDHTDCTGFMLLEEEIIATLWDLGFKHPRTSTRTFGEFSNQLFTREIVLQLCCKKFARLSVKITAGNMKTFFDDRKKNFFFYVLLIISPTSRFKISSSRSSDAGWNFIYIIYSECKNIHLNYYISKTKVSLKHKIF